MTSWRPHLFEMNMDVVPSCWGNSFAFSHHFHSLCNAELPHIKVWKGNLSLSTLWRHTRVSTATSPHILNLGTKWGWVVNFTPQLLYSLGKNPGTHWTEHWVRPNTGLSFPYWDLSHLSNWYSEEVLKIHFHWALGVATPKGRIALDGKTEGLHY